MARERPDPATQTENREFNKELKSFGTSELQIRSMIRNFDPGEMCQFNHHIEFLSPNGNWFLRLTRVGTIRILEKQIDVELPTGVFHGIERDGPGEEIITQYQVESGDIVLEIYPVDKMKDSYWYQSITANFWEHSNSYVPLVKFYNLTKILTLPTPKEFADQRKTK